MSCVPRLRLNAVTGAFRLTVTFPPHQPTQTQTSPHDPLKRDRSIRICVVGPQPPAQQALARH